ncbi:hypothetical protein V2G26_017390 [Clonostachys chloroleuca]
MEHGSDLALLEIRGTGDFSRGNGAFCGSRSAGLKTPAMKRKPACDGCYRRKIQCDSPDPGVVSCNWCLHHDLSCTLQRVRGRKATSASFSRDKRYIGAARALRPATITQPPKTVSSSSSTRATIEAPNDISPATPLGSPSCSGGVNDPLRFSDKTRAEYYADIS